MSFLFKMTNQLIIEKIITQSTARGESYLCYVKSFKMSMLSLLKKDTSTILNTALQTSNVRINYFNH